MIRLTIRDKAVFLDTPRFDSRYIIFIDGRSIVDDLPNENEVLVIVIKLSDLYLVMITDKLRNKNRGVWMIMVDRDFTILFFLSLQKIKTILRIRAFPPKRFDT